MPTAAAFAIPDPFPLGPRANLELQGVVSKQALSLGIPILTGKNVILQRLRAYFEGTRVQNRPDIVRVTNWSPFLSLLLSKSIPHPEIILFEFGVLSNIQRVIKEKGNYFNTIQIQRLKYVLILLP